MENEEEKKTNIYKILCIIMLAILICVLVAWGYTTLVQKNAQNRYEQLQEQVNSAKSAKNTDDDNDDSENLNGKDTTETATEVAEESDDLQETDDVDLHDVSQTSDYTIPEKNIDWDSLQAVNSDIYAWIYIPGTDVDYPVLQSVKSDTYYLNHNLDGSWGRPGCVYSESINSKAFTDYNTVLYGHNMKSGAMFRTLHNFEQAAVFDEYKYVYIYTPKKTLVYEIFAAYDSDDKHILNIYDFSSSDDLQDYLNDVFKNAAKSGNVRDDISVTGDNAILTLSTCTSYSNKRYLVQAVLINE